MTTTNSLTSDEREERLTKPYKEHLRETLKTTDDYVGYLTACHDEGPETFALAVRDVTEFVATSMRDLCVEKVKKKAASYQADVDRLGAALKYRERMAYTASALREVANELQSLTLNQQPVKEEFCCLAALIDSRERAAKRKLEQEQK